MNGKGLSRRDFLILSAGAATGALLAACQPQATGEPEDVSEEEEAPAAVPAAPEQVSISFLALHDAWEDVLPYFYDDYPNIVVEGDYLSWDAFFEQIQVRLASGASEPDVLEVDVPMTAPYGYRDWLLPLDSAYTQEEKEDWLDAALRAGTYEGELLSAPMNTSTQLLMYNKSHFDRAGIEPPEEDDRWTWEQVADAALQLTFDDNDDGVPEVWGFMWEQYQRIYQLQPMPMSLGGEAIGDDGLTVRGVIDSEPWIEAFTYYWRAFNDWKFAPNEVDISVSDSFFRGGILSMELCGSWNIGNNAEAIEDFEWGVSRHPYFERGEVVTPTGSWHMGVNAKTQKPDEAISLVHWVTTSKGNELYWRHGPRDFPVCKSVLALFETDPEFDEPPMYYERVAAREAVVNPQPRPVTPGYLEYEEILAGAFEDMRTAGTDVEQALATAVDRIEVEMAKYA